MVADETTTRTHFEEQQFGEPAATTSQEPAQKQQQQQQQQQQDSDEKKSSPKAQRKQPIGAAPAKHLSTFLGSSSSGTCNSNVNKSQAPQQQFHHHHHHHRKASSSQAAAARNKHLSHLSQSQARINHSLESIDSKYSTSSANDDSAATTHSMRQHQQQQQHQTSSKLSPQLSNKLLSISCGTAQVSGGNGAANITCSPIEAQLASSTCDLGIKLTPDAGWRGSFSASTGASALSSVRTANGNSDGDGGKRPPSTTQISVISGPDQPTTTTAADTEIAGPPKAPFMFAGVVASLVGSVFFSLSVLCIKLLPAQEGFGEKVKALCFRGFFVTILCGLTIIIQRSTIKVGRDELLVNILRAVFGTCGVLGLYSAISYISMGDATALIFSSPVWTSILSHFILGEPLQWLQLFALPASLFGIVLIAHPALIVDVGGHGAGSVTPPDLVSAQNESSLALVANGTNHLIVADPTTTIELQPHHSSSFDLEHRWPGIVIALATSLLVSCVYIALKFRKKTPIQTTTFWFGAFMIFAALSMQIFTGPIDIPLTVYEWSLLFGNGVTSWLGQSCLQWAFLYEEAGVLSIVRTLDVAMTFALSALFLGEEILWTSIVGATIIGLVVVSIMLNEWIKKVSCLHGSACDEPEQVVQSKKSLAAGSGKQSAYMVASKA